MPDRKLVLMAVLTVLGTAHPRAAAPQAVRRAAIPLATNVRYTLGFDSSRAARRTVRVGMRFDVPAGGPVLLSMPAWTPGAYEISNFARKVSDFNATSGGADIPWDKSDFDTWRVRPERAGTVEIGFDVLADSLDNAMAWARPDFLLVNGTNVFPYLEGLGTSFTSRISVATEPGWRIVTGLAPEGAPGQYRAADYHDLVDMPFFIGRLDLDSAKVEGVWHYLASYPAGELRAAARQTLWDQIAKMVPEESKVFGETPWRNYSTLLIFEPS
ncbi:MAG TPA: hypothetical protein VF187_01275, partial [Gemmatimonadales bacterium]